MRVLGKKTLDMGKLSNDTRMATATMVTLRWAKLMVRAFTPGPMAKFTMANGFKDSSKVMEYGEDCTTILTSASGLNPKRMAMVYTHGKTVIDMKVSGICV